MLIEHVADKCEMSPATKTKFEAMKPVPPVTKMGKFNDIVVVTV